MSLLANVKAALRISSTAFDTTEIQPLIDSAKADMVLCGITTVKANDETNDLIVRAITTYCKANFGYNNPDADKLQQSYEMLRNHLSLSIEYNGGDSDAV